MMWTGLFNGFAHGAAQLTVTGLWQGLVVAAALALGLRLSPRVSAAHRFVIWSAGFVAIAALPLLALGLRSMADAAGLATRPAGAAHTWLQLDVRWIYVLASVWLTASLVRGADLVFHVLRLRRLWRTATPIEVPALPLSGRRCEVCTTEALDRPSVIGFFAPRVLIPSWLLGRLTSGEFEQVVLHEQMHLERRDDWTNLLQKLCLVLFPLNPALWVIDRQLDKEREMACDEAVVGITQAPRAYAACLAGLAERGLAYRKEALSLGAWQRRPELVRRVHRILSHHRSLPPATARVLLGAFGCSLLVATVELARCPKLVAFVPATAPEARASVGDRAADGSGDVADAVYPTGRVLQTADAHLVETKAEMPPARLAKAFAGRTRAKAPAEGELRTVSSESGPTAHAVASRRAGPAEAPRQLIVFAAWEQVETTATQPQKPIADYETEPADTNATSKGVDEASTAKNDGQGAEGKATPGASQSRTTVTQLILRIAPSGSKPTHSTAIPLGNGWFVIQL